VGCLIPTQYSRGRAFEYKVIKHLKKTYPLVVRSAGSKGPIDVVAVNERITVLVSCKKAAYWPVAELKSLRKLSRLSNYVVVSRAYLNRFGKLEFEGV
jgi:Holliday junction resolvase